MIRVRLANPEDFPRIRNLSRSSFDRVYAFFAVRGAQRANPVLVAEEDGGLIGFLEALLFPGTPPIGYVYFVAVDPARRGRGTGQALVVDALDRFRMAGATRAFAAVPDDNEASRRLFGSLGFQAVPRSVLRRWYGWRGIAVQMRMVLAPHEVLMARTFADPSPVSAQDIPDPS